ncbi:uncharacterized protein LOC129881538 isoform X2 [Solanum dulcamara]|uniref:uncharacterized protein LOC129881538 isoform X2 n=1 Tax=Solanum dulcamara TaxID=45834 RepID=UPI0024864D8B|nr:uncharacterized protein LOC129881538 isoform X2 [Solanum dulcamara]
MAKNPKDATTSKKCFSGIFQRLLCGGNLPTHPCDEFKEPNRTTFDHTSQALPFKAEENSIIGNKVIGGNSPGIVARLMGLDSLPQEVEKINFGSFSRSRSDNSLDYLMHFNLTHQNFHHRRVRTSASFREIPNLDEEFKSEFLVFCFNDEKEEQTFRKSNQEMRTKKTEDGNRKDVHKKGQNRVDFSKEVSGKQNKIANNKVKKQVKFEDYPTKMSLESKKKKKRKSKSVVSTKIQPLFNNSADSSPIHLQQAATIPAEGKMQLNSRKSPARVTDLEHAITSKVEKQKEISKETDHYIKVVGEICRLTEEKLNESHWITAIRTGENIRFEDLCLEFGQEVLELLLDQLVHELVIFAQ